MPQTAHPVALGSTFAACHQNRAKIGKLSVLILLIATDVMPNYLETSIKMMAWRTLSAAAPPNIQFLPNPPGGFSFYNETDLRVRVPKSSEFDVSCWRVQITSHKKKS